MIYAGFKFTELIRLAYGVLDWGLGHATRSVPVIKALINKGITPLLVVSGQSGDYLKSVFPALSFETLPNSDIVYRTGKPVWQSVMLQLPNLHQWKKQASLVASSLAQQGFTHFISDNLYGFYAAGTKNALITHQTSPAFPISFPGSDYLSARLFGHLISPFQNIWIPVEPENQFLISPLIKHFHKNVRMIGWLSALQAKVSNHSEVDWLVALSGPEWYRTELEESLISEWPDGVPVHFVRGTDRPLSPHLQINDAINLYNQLNNVSMSELWFNTRFLIARSGYSTVMDALSHHKKAIWIPTPGQTEQLLLGEQLEKNRMGVCLLQSELSQLKSVMNELSTGYKDKLQYVGYHNRLLDVALEQFLHD